MYQHNNEKLRWTLKIARLLNYYIAKLTFCFYLRTTYYTSTIGFKGKGICAAY